MVSDPLDPLASSTVADYVFIAVVVREMVLVTDGEMVKVYGGFWGNNEVK